MYLNNNLNYSTTQACNDCIHFCVCQYKNEMLNAKKERDGIKREQFSPIRISVTCEKYNKKTQRQDGSIRGL